MEPRMVELMEDLDSAIEAALWEYDPIRESLSALAVDVQPDGTVTINGHVRSGLLKDGVLETVRRVAGVSAIVEELHADSEIEFAVARALAKNPALSGLPPGAISVHSHLGQVTLVGRVPGDSEQSAAVETAQATSGVTAVVSHFTDE